MANLFNAFILKRKSVRIALKRIYGINFKKADIICSHLGIQPSFNVSKLTEKQKQLISNTIDKMFITGIELNRQTRAIKKQIIESGTYKGYRHKYNLPVRGQRTSTNAKTRKKFNR